MKTNFLGAQKDFWSLFFVLLFVLGMSIYQIASSSRPVDALAGTPDAVNDSLTMYQDGGTVEINWISNDDMDDNATLNSFDAASTNGGAVSDNGDGTFNYTPAASYSGGDGFTYTICDDDTPTPECDTASVSITVVATTACLTGFYQTLSGEINILDTTSSPATYVSAAPDLGELNATGFNPNDGLIYGFSSDRDEVVSFDPNTGVFTDVFTHTEDAPFAGDFDSSNNLYYNRSSDTVMWIYNSATDMRTSITLNTSHGAADIAYVPNDDRFYGIQSGGSNAAVVNAGTATVTTQALSGPITSESGGFGATWVTGNDTLYAFNNDSGNIFSINTSTWVSTLVTTSSPNGSNDGMSCAAGASPFDISSILDYGDAPDTYGTTLAMSGASAVVNTSYRIGNFNEIDADGQPSTGADADDLDDVGDDEDGAFISIESLEDNIIYEAEPQTIDVKVPLDNGYVSMWLDLNGDGDFADAGEQVATDVVPSSGNASLAFTLPENTSTPFDSYARIRLAARTGGTATGLFSFGEVEDYEIEIYPSRPTITNDALSAVSLANRSAYTVTGTCTDDGDSIVVTISDGSNPDVTSAATTCSSGTFSRTLDVSSLDDGSLTVTSTIDDTYNAPVSDVDNVTEDTVLPTIDQAAAGAISNANQSSYPVSGTCTADGDAITVTLTDSDSPANMAIEGTTCSSGMYSVSVDASGLIEGTVNVESSIDDDVNPAVTDDENVTQDSVLPTITQSAAANINNANASSYPVSGTCTANGDAITVTLTDSDSPANTASTSTTCGSGTYSVNLDASGLIDGSVDVESSIDDGINPAVTDDEDVTKDSTVPTITLDALVDVEQANETAWPVSGVCTNDGDTVVVTVSDSINPDVVSGSLTCTSGAFSTTLDVSSLDNTSLTVDGDITDSLSNTANDSDTVDKDDTPPTITINMPVDVTMDNTLDYVIDGTCTDIGDFITVLVYDDEELAIGFTLCDSDNTFSVEFDLSSFDPGTLVVDASITDGINPDAMATDSIEMPTDLDDDDTTSEEEQAGPNDGDGNNDGTPDFLQDSVTTKVNPVIDAYVTTEAVGDCDALDAVTFEIEPNLAAQDSEFDYELGLHGFNATCSAPGGSVTVTHYWDQEYDTTNWIYRKFLSSTNSYINFNDNVTYGTAEIGGNTVTTVTFTVTDGGEYDADGLENGEILDPVGPAVNGLADTGQGVGQSIFVGLALAVATIALAFNGAARRKAHA